MREYRTAEDGTPAQGDWHTRPQPRFLSEVLDLGGE
jgi:hypothetical protein